MYRQGEEKRFLEWLRKTCSTSFKYHVELTSLLDFKEIYEAATNTIIDVERSWLEGVCR